MVETSAAKTWTTASAGIIEKRIFAGKPGEENEE
jgi:hypothetical protein